MVGVDGEHGCGVLDGTDGIARLDGVVHERVTVDEADKLLPQIATRVDAAVTATARRQLAILRQICVSVTYSL